METTNQEEVKFDVNAFKAEMKEQNESLSNSLVDKVTSQVQEMLQKNKDEVLSVVSRKGAEGVKVSSIDPEFKEELELLAADEEQATALMKLVNKALQKQLSGVTETVLTKVSENNELSQEQTKWYTKAREEYPEALNKRSALFDLAKVKFAALDKALKASPRAEYIAISEAAEELGIEPRKMSKAKDTYAEGQGGGSPPQKREKSITDDDIEFGKFFNVDVDKFKKHLKSKLS